MGRKKHTHNAANIENWCAQKKACFVKPTIQSHIISPSLPLPPSFSHSHTPSLLQLSYYSQIDPYDSDTESQDDFATLNASEAVFEISDPDDEAKPDEFSELDDAPPSFEAFNTILTEAQARLAVQKHLGQCSAVAGVSSTYSGTKVNGALLHMTEY